MFLAKMLVSHGSKCEKIAGSASSGVYVWLFALIECVVVFVYKPMKLGVLGLN